MIRRLLGILGWRTMLTFGLVTFLVGALLATVNITSRYALKTYVDDQLGRIPWDLAVYQQGACYGNGEFIPDILSCQAHHLWPPAWKWKNWAWPRSPGPRCMPDWPKVPVRSLPSSSP